MKISGILLILLGVAVVAAGMWFSHIQLGETFRKELSAIQRPSAGQPPSTASSAVGQAREQLIESRRQLDQTLSDLRSVKTVMVITSRNFQFTRHEPEIRVGNTEPARQSIISAQRDLERLRSRIEDMNSATLRAESQTRDVLAQYENAWNLAIEEAVQKSTPGSSALTSFVIPIIGALVSIVGLVISWRSKDIEIEKTNLEIQELREKYNSPKTNG